MGGIYAAACVSVRHSRQRRAAENVSCDGQSRPVLRTLSQSSLRFLAAMVARDGGGRWWRHACMQSAVGSTIGVGTIGWSR